MKHFPTLTINTGNPDPTEAINAFLWCMAKARSLGMVPPTEHTLAEHMFRKDAKLVFYSSAGGITALCMDDGALNDDDAFEMIQFVADRRRKRLAEKRAEEEASAIAAQSDETPQAAQPEGQEREPKGDAQP